MGLFCCIDGCSNESGTGRCDASFFRLPAVIAHQGERTEELSSRRRRTWLSRISRADLQPKSYPYVRVCSEHFVNGKPSPLYDEENIDWAPSVMLGRQKPLITPFRRRKTRRKNREETKKQVEAAHSLLILYNSGIETTESLCDESGVDDVQNISESDNGLCNDTGTGTQTKLKGDYLSVLESDYNRSVSENIKLEQTISKTTTSE